MLLSTLTRASYKRKRLFDPSRTCDFTTYNLNYLVRDDDLALLLWGYKKARELGRRMKCFRGEYLPNHPSFPAGSAAACHEHVEPAPLNAPDIVYTPEDDEAIKTHIRASGE